MNDDIIKTIFFHKIKFDLIIEGLMRLLLFFKFNFFFDISFIESLILSETCMNDNIKKT